LPGISGKKSVRPGKIGRPIVKNSFVGNGLQARSRHGEPGIHAAPNREIKRITGNNRELAAAPCRYLAQIILGDFDGTMAPFAVAWSSRAIVEGGGECLGELGPPERLSRKTKSG
jgi:hypothetical protein